MVGEAVDHCAVSSAVAYLERIQVEGTWHAEVRIPKGRAQYETKQGSVFHSILNQARSLAITSDTLGRSDYDGIFLIMPLMPVDAFSHVLKPLQREKVGYIQGQFGNAGDGLIHNGTLQLFAAFGIDFEILNEPCWPRRSMPKIPPHITHLVLFGGGSMGAPASRSFRDSFAGIALPKTLLPQSWRAEEPANYDRIFVRELESLRFSPNAVLAHDLGLAFTPSGRVNSAPVELGVLLRQDGEACFSSLSSDGDPAVGLSRLDAEAYVQRAARYRTIITDRLHFAIAGLLIGRRVILLPGNYHKNRGVFRHSLEGLGCLWAEDPIEARQLV